MFTTITQFIGNPPRHAESADTRQEIKRHDPDQQNRREHEEREDDGLARDDSAVVSVSALEVFLKNFLQSMADDTKNKEEVGAKTAAPSPQAPSASSPSTPQTPTPETPAHGQTRPNSNSAAARAASAYGRNAGTRNTAVATPSPEALEALLGGEDVRIIHGLLDDIAALKKKNIEYLSIEKGESFLMSLKAAVDKAKGS